MQNKKRNRNRLTTTSLIFFAASVLAAVLVPATIFHTGAFSWDAFVIAVVGGWTALFALFVSLVFGVLAWVKEGGRTRTPKIIVCIEAAILLICAVIAYLKLTPPGI